MSKPKVHPFKRREPEPDPPAVTERENLTVTVHVGGRSVAPADLTDDERIIIRMMARRAVEAWLKGEK